MKPQPAKIGFNKEWAKKVGKTKFLEHFKNVYPLNDLEAEWNKISPPKEDEKAIEKPKKEK